ncbi:MAG TPA: AAA family ATPase, partial [Propionicimonas sp.]
KLGKSCLVYQIAVEVALGGELLGRAIEQGDVLYLALEDGKRRGQTRLRAALGDRPMPRGRLEVRWAASKLGEGLEQELLDWLDQHTDARLVAIDTLQRVRARGDARRNAYEVDVEDLARLQDIFKDRAVGLLIVHHSKKDAGDDFLASVSGTYGITGSADTTLVIQRKRLETFGKLVVTGRDVQEVEEPVQFNGMTWSSAPRSLAEASFEQAEVYKVIEAEGPIFPKAIADLIGSSREAAQRLVEKLVAGGSVARARGGYVVARVGIAGEAEEAETPERGAWTSSPHSSLARGRAGVTTASTSSASSREIREEAEEAGTRVSRVGAREAAPVLRVVPADPTGWANPCHWYRDHQFKHRQTPSGWTCVACYPEEGPTA